MEKEENPLHSLCIVIGVIIGRTFGLDQEKNQRPRATSGVARILFPRIFSWIEYPDFISYFTMSLI